MGDRSAIEWTDATWSPVIGCTHCSAGCVHCWAPSQARRLSAPGKKYHGLTMATKNGPKWNGKVRLVERDLDLPLRWRASRRIFVCDMGDLFHEDVPEEWIDRIFAVMASASAHTFQILTKRPERMLAYLSAMPDRGGRALDAYAAKVRAEHAEHCHAFDAKWGQRVTEPPTPELRAIYDSAARAGGEKHFSGGEYHWREWPLSNVHLGVSVENQAAADGRIPLLLQTPAAVRFLSVEPLIDRVGFDEHWLLPTINAVTREQVAPRIDWVIVGGESGPGARPCDLTWIRSVVSQCKASGVSCFVKQLGASPYYLDAALATWSSDLEQRGIGRGHYLHLKDRKGGDPAEWPADLRVREFPATRVPTR